ncbi:hypothetical protein BGX30_012006 [Mortierella sp. GBA39]|nr:hypothetical protein BGX30_012006 [Mortierella sp. GBA39]
MKFMFCATVLALVVTQTMAVVPIPVKECTKSVVVQPTDTTCSDFAQRFGVTFDDLLKWNQKLRMDCLNLDVGHPICVSVTPGDCCLSENPKPTATTTTTLTTTTPIVPIIPSIIDPSNRNNAAAAPSAKGSMRLAVAGVILSAVYAL